MRAKITARATPCNCGCRGADPWHARTFDRVLRDVVEERGEAFVSIQPAHAPDPLVYRRRAEVVVPWSDVPVPVVDAVAALPEGDLSLGWLFVR